MLARTPSTLGLPLVGVTGVLLLATELCYLFGFKVRMVVLRRFRGLLLYASWETCQDLSGYHTLDICGRVYAKPSLGIVWCCGGGSSEILANKNAKNREI